MSCIDFKMGFPTQPGVENPPDALLTFVENQMITFELIPLKASKF
jgi:hypothetical protein